MISMRLIWDLVLPAALVAIGIGIITGNAEAKVMKDNIQEAEIVEEDKNEDKNEEKNEKKNEKPEYSSYFSGQKIDYAGKKFEGCKVDAVFGGIELDLSEAEILDGAEIKANGVFGGVKIILPKNVKLEVCSSSFLGGVTNDYNGKGNEKKTIKLKANCVFGGVEVK